MTKQQIYDLAIGRGYSTVSTDDTKAQMISNFLNEQGG